MTDNRPDPRLYESWCHTNRDHDHEACGDLLDSRNRSVFREIPPTVRIPYTDRALLPMLGVRKAVLEQHGLMKEAREVGEQMTAVGNWQRVNLDKLTPYPGVIPTRLDGAA